MAATSSALACSAVRLGDALEDPPALLLEVADLGLAAIQLGQLGGQPGLAFLDAPVLLVEALLALGQPVFAPLHLEPLLAQVVADRLGLGLGLPPYVGRPQLGFPPYLGRAVLGATPDLLGALLGRLGPDPQYGGLFLGLAADELGGGLGAGSDGGCLELRVRLGGGRGRGRVGDLAAGQREADPGKQADDQQPDQDEPD